MKALSSEVVMREGNRRDFAVLLVSFPYVADTAWKICQPRPRLGSEGQVMGCASYNGA